MIVQEGFIREDFAGPGGWGMGLQMLGLRDVGVEFEADAVATARAAGLKRWHVDVTSLAVRDYRWPRLWGYIASPPCQTFSMAGGGAGRKHLASLVAAVEMVAVGRSPEVAIAMVQDEALDERSILVLEPLFVIVQHRPEWVALEQVPAVLPIWEAYAVAMRAMGYSVDTGFVHAEQHGVPQTRKRAVLVASRTREARLPASTHSKFHSRTPEKLDDGVQKWVSMAEALGWGMIRRPSMTVAGGGTGAGGAEPFGNGARQGMLREIEAGEFVMRSNYGTGGDAEKRGERSIDMPAPTMTSKAGRNFWQGHQKPNGSGGEYQLRDVDFPAPTITGGSRSALWQEGDLVSPQSVEGGERARRSVDQPSVTVTGNFDRARLEAVKAMGSGMVERHGDRPGRLIDEPAFTVRANAGGMEPGGFRWSDAETVEEYRDAVASEVAGRVNNQSGTEFDNSWPADRPAPVIAGRDLVTMPGANANRFNGSTKSRNDGIRVTAQEAAILQSFPADHPWQGSKTSQFQQIGNAVPPLLAAAIIYQLTGPIGSV